MKCSFEKMVRIKHIMLTIKVNRYMYFVVKVYVSSQYKPNILSDILFSIENSYESEVIYGMWTVNEWTIWMDYYDYVCNIPYSSCVKVHEHDKILVSLLFRWIFLDLVIARAIYWLRENFSHINPKTKNLKFFSHYKKWKKMQLKLGKRISFLILLLQTTSLIFSVNVQTKISSSSEMQFIEMK